MLVTQRLANPNPHVLGDTEEPERRRYVRERTGNLGYNLLVGLPGLFRLGTEPGGEPSGPSCSCVFVARLPRKCRKSVDISSAGE